MRGGLPTNYVVMVSMHLFALESACGAHNSLSAKILLFLSAKICLLKKEVSRWRISPIKLWKSHIPAAVLVLLIDLFRQIMIKIARNTFIHSICNKYSKYCTGNPNSKVRNTELDLTDFTAGYSSLIKVPK